MTTRLLTRRRFVLGSVAAVVGGVGFGFATLVRKSQEAARHSADL